LGIGDSGGTDGAPRLKIEPIDRRRLIALSYRPKAAVTVGPLTSLNAKQEALRTQATTWQEGLNSVDHQIAVTTNALMRFKQDFKYLSKPDQEELVCPTCGAHYEESFSSILILLRMPVRYRRC
jgi:hypothetical protein